jgi:hypothetical protein
MTRPNDIECFILLFFIVVVYEYDGILVILRAISIRFVFTSRYPSSFATLYSIEPLILFQ